MTVAPYELECAESESRGTVTEELDQIPLNGSGEDNNSHWVFLAKNL
jgi:hypothetical protein